MFFLTHLILPFGTAGLVVLVHRLVMDQVSRRLGRLEASITPSRTVFAVVILLAAHLVEIGVFAGSFAMLVGFGEEPMLTGAFDRSLEDYLYYSGTAYTSLGIGDIVPHGAARIMTAVEAVTGLVMIAWTAAFLYAEAIY
ncbi:Membrane protein [Fulvimarina pelagi HTCC2506]|uniref:Membrane protein n=2 Tax=Fulvimarina pelagi TaxID=217511 RepID=Q0FZJ7_9HYPH|nr:ion channel [Fulvimarina pelagi]EAU40281.1 Membrane protein [Fulvimarina pelagi HTCC2506]BAT31321.1 membrane protein [Fulvimarina pelagi]